MNEVTGRKIENFATIKNAISEVLQELAGQYG
jgi:hypothetical protein